LPHHVTARGARREPIFFEDGDHDVYCDMLAEEARRVGVWAYCLMPNHVHLILVPARDARRPKILPRRGRWRGAPEGGFRSDTDEGRPELLFERKPPHRLRRSSP
jgi:hypothetical protein